MAKHTPRLPGMGLAALMGLVLAAAPLSARDYDGDIGILGGIVSQDEDLPGLVDQPTGDVSAVLGGRLGYLFSDHVGLFADGTHSWINTPHSGETGTLDFRGGLELYGPELWKNAPLYLAGAGGLERISFADVDSTILRPIISGGLGQRFGMGPLFGHWEVRATHAFKDEANATVATPSLGEAFTHYNLLLGVSLPFGGSDSDEDGIRDRADHCPDTPYGAHVNAKGCPLDKDGDGVFDGLDLCSDTPAGWPVDSSGCPTDKDGDGVADGADTCPNTPKGARVDAKGCAIDTDKDGVPDGIDKCKGTVPGAKVDAKGCAIDTDQDGVPDGVDQCPNTPAGTDVDARGCTILFEEERAELILEGVTFESNSATLRAESLPLLDRIAESLAAWPEVNVEIGGHTDANGAAAHNADLSRRRAETVRDYLMTKKVAGARLTVNGYGESEPIADNSTAAGRAQNRRVTLRRK